MQIIIMLYIFCFPSIFFPLLLCASQLHCLTMWEVVGTVGDSRTPPCPVVLPKSPVLSNSMTFQEQVLAHLMCPAPHILPTQCSVQTIL